MTTWLPLAILAGLAALRALQLRCQIDLEREQIERFHRQDTARVDREAWKISHTRQ